MYSIERDTNVKEGKQLVTEWFVYLIDSDAGLYCGITTDLERRFQQHLTGKGAKFFRRSKPKSIVYIEAQVDRSSASQREYQIKQLTRAQKLKLIAQFNESKS